jgi:hypothetical protein
MHPGCKSWGSFGFDKGYGLDWHCAEHKQDASESQDFFCFISASSIV